MLIPLGAMPSQSSEWANTSRERLNYIDNNIDLFQYMIRGVKSK